MAGGVRHAPAPGADRRSARPAEVAADSGVPRERARAAGAQGRPAGRRDASGSRPRSSSIPASIPAYLHLGDAAAAAGRPDRRHRDVGALRSTCRPIARTSRSIGSSAPTPTLGTDHRFAELCRRLTAASPREWRARTALARHLLRRRPAGPGARAAVRSARAQPACAGDPPGASGRRCRRSICRSISSRATSRSPGSQCSISTRTSACAAAIGAPSYLAVSALPRVGHVRRGAHHAGHRYRSRDSGRPRRLTACRDRPSPAARRAHGRHRHRQVSLSRGVRRGSAHPSSTPTCWRATRVAPGTPGLERVVAPVRCRRARHRRRAGPRRARPASSSGTRTRGATSRRSCTRRVYAAIRSWFDELSWRTARQPRSPTSRCSTKPTTRATSTASSSRPAVRDEQQRRVMARDGLSARPRREQRIAAQIADRRQAPARRLRHRHERDVRAETERQVAEDVGEHCERQG